MRLNAKAVLQDLVTALVLAQTATAVVDPNCTQSSTLGGSLTVYYDPTSQQVVMDAIIPSGSYQAWGWGPSMTNTEIVAFSAQGAASVLTAYLGVGD